MNGFRPEVALVRLAFVYIELTTSDLQFLYSYGVGIGTLGFVIFSLGTREHLSSQIVCWNPCSEWSSVDCRAHRRTFKAGKDGWSSTLLC